MFGKKKKMYNLKHLEQDLMITIPSTNKFLDKFSYFLFQELGKKDTDFVNAHQESVGRIGNALFNIEESCERAVRYALEESAAWPNKRHWYSFLFKKY